MKLLYLSLGFIGLGLGAVGAVLPLLPSFPFLCLAAFGFAKGSSRLNDWFRSTRLYRNNLEPYIKTGTMTKKVKVRIMATVSIIMLISFIFMHRVRYAQIILFLVWIGHIAYFVFGIKSAEE